MESLRDTVTNRCNHKDVTNERRSNQLILIACLTQKATIQVNYLFFGKLSVSEGNIYGNPSRVENDNCCLILIEDWHWRKEQSMDMTLFHKLLFNVSVFKNHMWTIPMNLCFLLVRKVRARSDAIWRRDRLNIRFCLCLSGVDSAFVTCRGISQKVPRLLWLLVLERLIFKSYFR